MLERQGNLIVNRTGNPIALIKECDGCILINNSYWGDRNIKNRVCEIVGGTVRLEVMPRDVYVRLAESQANKIVGKGWL